MASLYPLLTLYPSLIISCLFLTSLVSCSECKKKAVIFNFGDSNSDTGGLCAGLGYTFGYPNSRTYFHEASGRLCDGRLIIDYLCEALNTSMLTPYLESLAPDFSNGANFAIGGSSTLPKYVPFSLDVQILEYLRFKSRSSKLYSKGLKNLVGGEEEFKNALYMIDIGQNDLAGAFSYLEEPEVINKIPSFISEIRDALWEIYKQGGRHLWVHNTGPLGCLPQKLATRSNASGSDIDGVGCLKSMNEAAMVFNGQLKALCDELRIGMQNATIVYVDIFTIKYDLIANSTKYGFKNPLMACCGFGGPPYNYKQSFSCGQAGYNVCEEGSRYVSWDGVHYTDAANSFVASKILSTNHSAPPIPFDFFCKS
ncbi:hypothetical protein LIER_26116 [Lithospermum erythrorhizon]|uniref:Uncharacterized protein n=1 Tax=Lithospermum erythrorhizon TaxID=34254 RepID=A0AAV3RB89_LITER